MLTPTNDGMPFGGGGKGERERNCVKNCFPMFFLEEKENAYLLNGSTSKNTYHFNDKKDHDNNNLIVCMRISEKAYEKRSVVNQP